MNLKNVLIKITAIVTVICTIVSCDDDFNSVGSEVIGDVNFEDKEYTSEPVAYSKRFVKVQTSGLPNNLIGVYNDPVYGESTYKMLSQVIPERLNPTFGEGAVLDSIVVSLPYYSTRTATNTEGEVAVNTYELDSVYGSEPFRLSIYKSDYFLKDSDITVDPGTGEVTEDRQVYYSDDIPSFGMTVEGRLIAAVENFEPSEKENILVTEDGTDEGDDPDVSTIPPRARIAILSIDAAAAAEVLNPNPNPDPMNIQEDDKTIVDQGIINYFTEQFLDKEGSIELSNTNNFNNYFRGIYFKAESNSANGSLVFFDRVNANITLHYSFDTEVVDTDDEDNDDDTTDTITVREPGSLALTFSGNIVNGIDFDFDADTAADLNDQDEVDGEDNLFLKGGEGSFAVIDLFNKDVTNENGESENELDFLRRQDWLINEASMKLYINQEKVVSGDTEPERIYIFNLETGAALIDYFIGESANDTNPVQSRTQHLGRISRDSDDKGEFYKILLTRHIIDILNEGEDNVKLGLSVSQNVNITANAQGFTSMAAIMEDEDEIIPFSSIISHEGTILYGNGSEVPEDKRLKLDIFYTEAKE